MIHAVLEDSWPYFNQVSQFSGPLGIPFFSSEEAERIYNSVAQENVLFSQSNSQTDKRNESLKLIAQIAAITPLAKRPLRSELLFGSHGIDKFFHFYDIAFVPMPY